MLFLLSEGHCSRFFYPSKVSENLTPCNSEDSRKVAVMENSGAGDWLLMVSHLILHINS